MTRRGSKKAICATAKETPCLTRLIPSFASSHSKVASIAIWQICHILIWCNSAYSCRATPPLQHLALARDLRDAAGRLHPHVVGFLGGVTSGRTENHDGVAQRSTFGAGDVGEDFTAQPHLAGVGDGNDVEDRFATRDVVASFVQAVLQIGGQGGCSGLRRGERRLRAGERILRQRRRRDGRYLLWLAGILRQSRGSKAGTQSDCKNEAFQCGCGAHSRPLSAWPELLVVQTRPAVQRG